MTSTLFAGDFIESFHGEGGTLRTGLPNTAEVVGSSVCWVVSSVALLAGWGSGFLALVGLVGLLINGLRGVFSNVASSSSESTSLESEMFCPSFFGLRGDFSFFSSVVVDVDLVLALVALAPAAGFRTGLARRPVAASAAFSFAFVAAVGTLFSFSGSWNVTVFLVTAFSLDAGLETADFKPGVGSVEKVVVTVPASLALDAVRLRTVFFTGSDDVAVLLSPVVVFRTRVRVVLGGSALTGSVTVFFVRPRVVRVCVVAGSSVCCGSGSDSGSGAGSTTLLGLPLALVGAFFIALCSRASSSSSDLFFRLFVVRGAVEGLVEVVVLVVLVVLVLVLVLAVVVFAFAVVGATLAGLIGLVVVADSFAAALARVIRLGGLATSILTIMVDEE